MIKRPMAPISVAIATYNSESFIVALLESILSQTVLPSEIICYDDCSSDSTIDLIEEFSRQSQVPIRVKRHEKNVGVIENFLSCFEETQFDIVSYCDHDDVWLSKRLEQAWSGFASREVSLVCQPSVIVDENLNRIGKYFNIKKEIFVQYPFIPIEYHAWGHQMLFRRSVLRRLQKLYKIDQFKCSAFGTNFDNGILLAASMEGGVLFQSDPQLLFRRHSKSTSDAGKVPNQNLKERILGKIISLEKDTLYRIELSTKIEKMCAEFDENRLTDYKIFLKEYTEMLELILIKGRINPILLFRDIISVMRFRRKFNEVNSIRKSILDITTLVKRRLDFSV